MTVSPALVLFTYPYGGFINPALTTTVSVTQAPLGNFMGISLLSSEHTAHICR